MIFTPITSVAGGFVSLRYPAAHHHCKIHLICCSDVTLPETVEADQTPCIYWMIYRESSQAGNLFSFLCTRYQQRPDPIICMYAILLVA
jgi:hypothetical protein